MKRQTRKQTNPHINAKGAAMIEFAIVLPFLLIVIVGVLELGLILIQDNTLNKSVRESARYLSSNWGVAGCYRNIAEDVIRANMDTMFESDYSNFNGSITMEQVCVNETSGAIGASSALNADCSGTPNFCGAGTHLHVRASATYPHQMIINNLMGLNFTPNLSATAMMRVQ